MMTCVGDPSWVGTPRPKTSNTRHICGQAALFSGKFAPKNLHWTFKPECSMQGGLRRASEPLKAILIRDMLSSPKTAGSRHLAKEAMTTLFKNDTAKLVEVAKLVGVSESRVQRALKTSGWMLPTMIVMRALQRKRTT